MQFSKYLGYLIKGGLLLTLFLPLVVTRNMFFPFITPKNFLFRVIVEILFFLWLILLLRDPSYRPKRSWILIAVLATVGFLILSTIFGIDPARSLWSNYERMEGLVGHLHLLAFLILFASFFRSRKDWWWFFHVSIFVSLIVGFYALLQLAGQVEIHQGGTRIDATLGNATYLAVYLLFHLFFILYFFLKASRIPWRIFYALIFILHLFLLFQTATRGAILGFIGGLFLFAFSWTFLSTDKKYRRWAVGVLAAVIVSVAGFYLIRDTNFIKESPSLSRLAGITLSEGRTRFIIWSMAFGGFKERPILGWGLENFNVVFNKYYDPRLFTQEPWFDRAHNVFLDWLIASGILGLLAYLGIFVAAIFYLFRNTWKKKDLSIEASVFFGLLGGYFFQNIFVFDQLTSYILFFGTLGYIHFLSLEPAPEIKKTFYKPYSGAEAAWTFSLIIILVFLLYFVNLKPFLENTTLLKAMAEAGKGNITGSHNLFLETLSYRTLGDREAREQLLHFASQIINRENIDQKLREAIFRDATNEMKLQIASSPDDARYHLFLGSVYNIARQNLEARSSLERALELSPKKQHIFFELAQTYIQSGDFKKAAELMREASNLAPDYQLARSNFVITAILAGDDQAVEEEISKLRQAGAISPEELQRFINAYGARKRFDKVVLLYQELIKLEPKNIQYRVALAASYLELGEREKAILELRKAIELDPNFKAQGEAFISEILAGRKPN